MSEIYENLSPGGHENMLVRIFTKIKNWVETVFQLKSADMTYSQYEQLSQAQKMDTRIRFLTEGVPAEMNLWYDSTTNTIVFAEGFASYDDETKTIKIGG